MAKKNLELRGIIYSKFENESEMARALGWSRQRLNKITNGNKVPNLFEVDEMAVALDRPFMDLAQIFLAAKSTNVDAV